MVVNPVVAFAAFYCHVVAAGVNGIIARAARNGSVLVPVANDVTSTAIADCCFFAAVENERFIVCIGDNFVVGVIVDNVVAFSVGEGRNDIQIIRRVVFKRYRSFVGDFN